MSRPQARAVGIILLASTWLLLVTLTAACLEYDLRGQASSLFHAAESDGETDFLARGRYVPQLTVAQPAGADGLLDVEISLDAFARVGTGGDADTSSVDLYRMKLRYATPRSETRLGLQQLNFGPAYLLRPLRWFDMLDPRDPLSITEGVYALSFRYVTPGNASLWLWSLYGNDEVKGYETLPTTEDGVEFGGRFQSPVPGGEMAFTFHRRRVDGPLPWVEDFAEHRYALDGRWDVEIGLWMEASLTRQASDYVPFRWQKMISLGGDYTLAAGNGIHVLVEHMAVDMADRALGWDWEENSHVSGFMVGYPLGLMDNVTAIGFYSWDEGDYSQYLGWERAWDMLTLNLSAFHYPGRANSLLAGGAGTSATGYGGQVVLVFNH